MKKKCTQALFFATITFNYIADMFCAYLSLCNSIVKIYILTWSVYNKIFTPSRIFLSETSFLFYVFLSKCVAVQKHPS